MDVLTDVLKVLRLRTSTYFCSEFMGSWGMDIPEGSAGVFHAVIEGECWLTLSDDKERIRLAAGDIVAFPTGGSHSIGDEEGEKRLLGGDVVERIQAGDHPFSEGKANATLLCGSFEYDASIEHPFLKDLPCLIHINNQENQEKWLHPFIEALAGESRSEKSGSGAIINCLTEILFVQLMRAYIQQSDDNEFRYMSALIHPQIGIALSHIHNDISAECSVEKLADVLAMSRTTFTDKFTRTVGVSPKKYITNWRMQKARSQLQSSTDAMIVIAENAGYNSEAAFNKAYKQFFGETPGATRPSR